MTLNTTNSTKQQETPTIPTLMVNLSQNFSIYPIYSLQTICNNSLIEQAKQLRCGFDGTFQSVA